MSSFIPWLGATRFNTAVVSRQYEVMLGKMLQTSPFSAMDVEVPYANSASVQWAGVSIEDETKMWASPNDLRNLSLRRGDLLVCEGGDVGRCAIFNGSMESIFQNSVHRVRPRPGADNRYLYYVLCALHASGYLDVLTNKATIRHFTSDKFRSLRIPWPEYDEQRRIADFLDTETGKIDNLVAKKRRLLALLDERIDSRVLQHVGESRLVNVESGTPTLPIRRVLTKVGRPAVSGLGVITAYRDGQVTDRNSRRAEGYTLSASSEPQGQFVQVGDVVVHGLDGFAGAIGTSEADGNCSPVYHVCAPNDGHDALFLGRLLRLLALQGYLGNFATSTRERAVDFRNWDLFGRIPIPVVPYQEQLEIGEWILKLRPLRAAIERSEKLAAERRQALITAAVTGEFDVSAASGRGIEE